MNNAQSVRETDQRQKMNHRNAEGVIGDDSTEKSDEHNNDIKLRKQEKIQIKRGSLHFAPTSDKIID